MTRRTTRLPVTHDQALAALDGLFRWGHWNFCGVHPLKTKDGWRTPWEGNGKGFPDRWAFHLERGIILTVEVKVGHDTLRPEQEAWDKYLREFAERWLADTTDDLQFLHRVWYWPDDRAEAERLLLAVNE